MENILKYIPISLVLLFGSKLMVTGAKIEDLLLLFILVIIVCLDKVLDKNKSLQELKEQLIKDKKEITAIHEEQTRKFEVVTKDLDNLKSSLAATRLQYGFSSKGKAKE